MMGRNKDMLSFVPLSMPIHNFPIHLLREWKWLVDPLSSLEL
jgi:hypothetical protein